MIESSNLLNISCRGTGFWTSDIDTYANSVYYWLVHGLTNRYQYTS